MDHCKVLNNFIGAYYTRILFIDATDFKAKIEKSLIKELQYIKDEGILKWIVYTSSEKSMKRLLKKMKNTSIAISEHASRDLLLQAYRDTING